MVFLQTHSYIGTVEEVAMDRFGLYKEVKIRPAADTNDVCYVIAVIRKLKALRGDSASQKELYWVLLVYILCFLSRWSVNESFFKIVSVLRL